MDAEGGNGLCECEFKNGGLDDGASGTIPPYPHPFLAIGRAERRFA